MRVKFNKTWSIVIAASMAAALAGCSTTTNTTSSSGENKTAPTAEKTSAPSATANVTYPIQSNGGLTYWGLVGNSAMLNYFPSLADTPFGKELAKRTGVNVKFIHPPIGQDREQFNLMMSSGELPDIIETDWTNGGYYPGGPQKAIDDKVIIPLNDLIKKYAPNLTHYLQSDKELAKMISTDSGQIYVFPMMRNLTTQVYGGPIIRKDWLDSLGLSVPTTIDEWETVLRAFKEKKGASAPFTTTYNSNSGIVLYNTFAGAYHTSTDFYIDDQGKVHYGPADDSYKDYLSLLRKWYAEGLIDRDFSLTTDNKTTAANMTSGKSGATIGLLGGGLGNLMTLMKDKDPKYEVVGAPYPTLKKGEKPFIGQYDFPVVPLRSAAVTTGAKDPALAVKWLDYAYGKEGNMLFNFGIENQNYTIDSNNQIQYSAEVLKDAKLNSIYTRGNGPFRNDERMFNLMYKMPQQLDAYKTWSNTDASKHLMNPFISPSDSESKELAKIITPIKTYKEESFLKFVMGQEPLENFSKYQAQLNQMGLPTVLKIYQDALERYNKR